MKDVQIVAQVPEDSWALAQNGPLSQVFLNLLLNAGQAMGGRGRVDVSCVAQGDGYLVLRVADRGPGIPPDLADRVFEPFFTTKQAGQGTGLGLAVCRHLMTQMGGSISAHNAQEGGAVFELRLPLPGEVAVAGAAP